MCSMRLVCARPVRIFFSCSLNAATHFCMRRGRILFHVLEHVSPLTLRFGRYHGADVFALDNTHQIAGVEQIEDLQAANCFPGT